MGGVAIDVTDASFEADVLNRSTQVPVVVDLWAPWCGPCKQLGPILEKVIGETDGAIMLAKVNVDENPRISQAFRVQSIPAVYALVDRKVVDQFVGALPEREVRAWLERLAPAMSEVDLLVAEGDEASLRRALELEPGHPVATVALAELLVHDGKNDEALALLAKIPETTEAQRVAALARIGVGNGAPDDASVVGELESLLTRVRGDEEARQRYVDLLAVLGDHPRVGEFRRRLASALF